MASDSAPSVGYCNTMGTATTMNSLAEALGMQLPGSAAIPAPYRERGQMAYRTGRRIVEMVEEDLKPSDVMTRAAFENAIVVNSAIGGSTNAPIHLNAIARHLGLTLTNDDWQRFGLHIPLLVDLQPAGRFLGEDYHRAGGVPGVIAELMKAGALPNPDALTVSGLTVAEAYADATRGEPRGDPALHRSAEGRRRVPEPQGQPLRQRHHEDQRDRAPSSATATCRTPTIPTPSKAAPSCSRGPRIITTGSTTRRWTSTSTASSSSAASAPSAIPAAPRW